MCREDDRDCEGGKVVRGGRPRLRGREGCVGRTAETAKEVRVVWGRRPRLPGRKGCVGRMDRDCEGGRVDVERTAETARGGKVVWGGRT